MATQTFKLRKTVSTNPALKSHSKKAVRVHQYHRAINQTTSVRVPKELVDRIEDPVMRQLVKEPVAFFGGMLAGVFGLNLEEDPLKTWIQTTAAAAGISYEVANRQVQQQLDSLRKREGQRPE
eukprot:TRINITY_DN6771_c0_g1_i1.p2 TRINITY_DN6771_c0_g1~~TRINITY_DN6771_c0_g1_i1.p2  ORF type:complete len:132 (-),score=12.56 TRINITY_DN6771_c0_g1_i1:249-617(-)